LSVQGKLQESLDLYKAFVSMALKVWPGRDTLELAIAYSDMGAIYEALALPRTEVRLSKSLCTLN
jgi:hypothetical protein